MKKYTWMICAVILLLSAVMAAGDASAATGSITGVVTNSSSAKLQGVWVYAYNASTYSFVAEDVTDSNGNYTLPELPSGSYKVQFDATGSKYLSEWHSNKATWAAATSVTVTAPSATTINAMLDTGATISGTVKNSSSVGIQGVLVYAYDASTYVYAAGATTASDGNYKLEGLKSGSYKVQFDASSVSYAGEWYNDKSEFSAATSVSATAPNVTANINAILASAGSISGTVANSSSAGIQGVTVYVYDASTQAFVSKATTGSTGAYQVKGLPSSTYKVWFDASETTYTSEWYNDKTDLSSGNAVTVSAPGTTSGVNAVLDAGGSISGKVINASSTAIQGVTVYAYSITTGLYVTQAVTDASGNYELGGLESDGYKIQFSAASLGYVDEWYNNKNDWSTSENVYVTAPNAMTGINATLDAGGSISGTVTNVSSTGLQGISVYAYSATTQTYVAEAMTGSGGAYEIKGLPTGSYKVYFATSANNYFPEWYSNKTTWASAGSVSVTAPSATTGVNASLAVGYAITASVEGDGSISPSGTVVVETGTSKTFTMTAADTSHRLVDVYVDGSSVGAVSTYTFNSVSSTHTIKAVFASSALPWLPVLLEE